ncbi:hypothetical protein [Pseudomonas purpurea]|uniref:hypothetical protein n=1 Tax=Pseudomonas purpurea TaxID=3136737 RepID=UPI003265C9A5
MKNLLLAVVLLGAGLIAQTAMASPACPSTDFATFVSAYSESQALQRTFVRLPLQTLLTVNAEPEPQQQRRKLSAGQLTFPLMPDAASRQAKGLVLRVTQPVEGKGVVVLEKPDTDYQVEYRFVFDQCWVLRERLDYSL